MRVIMCLLCLAFFSPPAAAVTYKLTGSRITSCTEYALGACNAGQVGTSFDGRVRLRHGMIPGGIKNRWFAYPVEGVEYPDDWVMLSDDTLKVKLGFPWEGIKAALFYIDGQRRMTDWRFTATKPDNTLWHEAAFDSIHISAEAFEAFGVPGQMVKIAPKPAAMAQASISPVPLPASSWLLLASISIFASIAATRLSRSATRSTG